jgi:predicted RecA/RadA family phage recombinase
VVVTITVSAGGVLEEDGVDDMGMDEGAVEIEGIVQAVDPNAHTVTITASDDGESGGSVTVGFPATFDLSTVAVGNEIEIKAIRQPDGTFVLSKLETENENDLADEADSQQGAGDRDRGDDNGGRGDSGDHHGGGDGGGGGGGDD